MNISLEWLGEFVDWRERNPQAIAQRLTACTAEVETIEEQGAQLAHCCVGKVLALGTHPNADKLRLCTVQTDQGKKNVVCGGTNLREGMRVAFAHVGATVQWHGEEKMTLESAKIRGETSDGMICAADEIGLSAQFPDCTGHSIIDLGDGDEGVGTPLASFLGLNDVIFGIDNHAITHRPDLFSHLGFARECVALGLADWKEQLPDFDLPKAPDDPPPFVHKVDCTAQVPRYCGCTLSIDAIGETPSWMRRRLEAVGLRSLNLPIDITNYVMLEIGMPLHSFDCDDFSGDVHIRTSKKDERIVTLDGVERVLPDGAVVISDSEGIFDLLGIMGGLRSSTKETTRTVYLHSAVVDPVAIRKAIVATGHRTDAATIYEKGIPHVIARMGLSRALQLFLELVPGARITSRIDMRGDDGRAAPIAVPVGRVMDVLGMDIARADAEDILTNLGCAVETNGDVLMVTPPLVRLGDLKGPHDIIEEIGRIYGFDRIEPVLPTAPVDPPHRDQRINVMRDALCECAYAELLPLSLLGPGLLKRCRMDSFMAAALENPLGEELSLLQPSVLPSLLEHAERNLLHVESRLCTFAVSQVFAGEQDQQLELGMLIAGREEPSLATDPFLLLKSHLAHVFSRAGYTFTVQAGRDPFPYAHPGRTAGVFIGTVQVGSLFEVHPSVRDAFGLPHRVSAALIDLGRLLAIEPSVHVAQPLPQFPAVTYDVTIPFSLHQSASGILAAVRAKSDLLESVAVTNLYTKESGSSEYNLTLRCVYRAKDRTLTEEEAKEAHKAVLKEMGAR